MSIITLCTDFGTQDGYVASMKGVILGINPSANVTDATHDIPPHDVLFAAFVLNGYYRSFPKGTVHVAVVDPGVGGRRLGMVVKTKEYVFVGPDNGVFSNVLMDNPAQCYAIGLPGNISRTFHGRDVFAPVAARMSVRWDRSVIGGRIKDPVMLDVRKPVVRAGDVIGEVIHVDRFGNLISNIPSGLLKSGKNVHIVIKGYSINGMAPTYEQCTGKRPCALIDSFGLLEIAVNSGSACRKLGARAGDAVHVSWK